MSSSREYPPRPIVGVGGVTFRGDRVLLAQRGKEPGRGSWSIPGGALKVGETLRQGVAREVREECSIEVEVGPVADVFERIIEDEQGRTRFHYVVLDYVVEYQSGELIPATDCLAAEWVSLSDLGRYNLTEAATAVILKAYAMRQAPPR